jgi:hypothetical protein
MFKKKILIGVLVLGLLVSATSFVFAASDTPVATVQCIQSAVGVRETALGLAVADYTRSIGIAYSDRAVALQSAYLQTGDKAVKSAVKTAWSNYSTFVKSVKNKWSMAKNEAWANFRSTVKNCKASSLMLDTTKSSSELAGN